MHGIIYDSNVIRRFYCRFYCFFFHFYLCARFTVIVCVLEIFLNNSCEARFFFYRVSVLHKKYSLSLTLSLHHIVAYVFMFGLSVHRRHSLAIQGVFSKSIIAFVFAHPAKEDTSFV